MALRQATRATALPQTAAVDVARAFSEAVLSQHASTPAWRALAGAVHLAHGQVEARSDVELAVSLVCLALATPAPPDLPALAVTLASLRRRLGHVADTLELARSAQDVARRAGDAPALASATLLLAEAVHTDGDEVTADAVIAHGARWLRELDPEVARRLASRWAAVRAAWEGPTSPG